MLYMEHVAGTDLPATSYPLGNQQFSKSHSTDTTRSLCSDHYALNHLCYLGYNGTVPERVFMINRCLIKASRSPEVRNTPSS